MSAERGSSQPIDAERDVFVRLPMGGDSLTATVLALDQALAIDGKWVWSPFC